MFPKLFLGLVITGLLLIALLPPPAVAGPEDQLLFAGVRFEGPQNLLLPIQRQLSGASALVISGQDSRFFKSNDVALAQGDVVFQAAGAAALVPYRSPSQKFSRNILLTRDLGTAPLQTEPAMAVNPKDPEHLVVGVIDYNFLSVVSYVSIDGGETWQGPYQNKYLEFDLGAAGDPIVDFDRDGNVYMGSISVGIEEFNIGGFPLAVAVSSISITKSTDGGFSWERPISSSRSTVELEIDPQYRRPQGELNVTNARAGFLRIGFLDKPWLTVGANPQDPSEDIVYVTYTHFIIRYDVFIALGGALFYFANPILETTIESVRSTDEGQTWSDPVGVSPTVLQFIGGPGGGGDQFDRPERVVQFGYNFAAPDGTLYTAYFDSTDDGAFEGLAEIYIARSDDGGQSFGPPRRVAVFLEPFFNSRTASFRSWSSAFPRGAVGPDDSVNLIFGYRPSAKATDDGDIYFTRSEDRGISWSTPRPINDDREDAYQFFPDLDVDPNGVIHAMWGDFRDDPSRIRYHIYYSRSEDGGKTWLENSRVTDFPSNPNRAFPNGAFIGDYYDLEATEDDVYMVWSDSRLGEFGAVNQKIAFARSKLMATPSIFISPPSGPAGRDVIISGFDFQPDQVIFITVSGVIVSTDRTDSNGRFSTQIFIPIAGEGAHPITAIEASGNVATASFFMDFGFDDLVDLQENIAQTRISVLSAVQNVTASLNRFGNGILGDPMPGLLQIEVDNLSLEIVRLQETVEEIARNGGMAPQDQTIVNTLLAVVLAVSVLSLFVSLRKKGT